MALKDDDVSFTSCAIPQQTVTQPIFNPLKKRTRVTPITSTLQRLAYLAKCKS